MCACVFVYLQAQIAQLHGYNTEEIILNCEGNALANETPVSALSSFELDITIPMLGGKVHGSLYPIQPLFRQHQFYIFFRIMLILLYQIGLFF